MIDIVYSCRRLQTFGIVARRNSGATLLPKERLSLKFIKLTEIELLTNWKPERSIHAAKS